MLKINGYFPEEYDLLSSNLENYFKNFRRCYKHHYTKINALKKILESRCIWLTHFSTLNDTSEGRLVLEEGFNRSKLTFDNDIYQLLTKNLYLCSFSLFGNQLSQWRSYGDVNIGFDYTNMESDLHFVEDSKSKEHANTGLVHVNCKYYDQNFDNIEETVRRISELVDKILPNNNSLHQNELLTIGALSFSTKHIGFEEEKESRIYAYLWDKEPFFTDSLIPYIKYHFEPERIKRIVIGPSPDQDLKYKLIEKFLEGKPEYKKVDIYKSGIPYILRK